MSLRHTFFKPLTVVITDQTEYGAWGRRLSENRLRSFNWQAECVCFARMKAEGREWKQIAEVFGLKSQEDVTRRVAIGGIPGLENIDTRIDVSLREAEQYLLPLRMETGRSPEDGNQRVYDYSEVRTCIDKLVSGGLTKEDLPAYSTERRLTIQQAQQDARLKEIAAAATPRSGLSAYANHSFLSLVRK